MKTIYRKTVPELISKICQLSESPRGVDLTNLCPDVCVEDSETDPFCGMPMFQKHTHFDGDIPILRDFSLLF